MNIGIIIPTNTPTKPVNWAHSMGPWRSRLSHVVVVVVVDVVVVDTDVQAACDSGGVRQ